MIKECDLDELKLIDAIRNTTKENKYLYGEVYTPLNFVENVLDIIPKYIFSFAAQLSVGSSVIKSL